MKNNKEFLKCVEQIEKLFWYDTVTFLDCVLTDDEQDPQYSAITVYGRLEMVVEFEKLYSGKENYDVNSLLLDNNYTQDDIDILSKKMQQEKPLRDLIHNKTDK